MSATTIELMDYKTESIAATKSAQTESLVPEGFALSSILDEDASMLDYYDPDQLLPETPTEGIDESILVELETIGDDANADRADRAFYSEDGESSARGPASSVATLQSAPAASLSPVEFASQTAINAQLEELQQKFALSMQRSSASRAQILNRDATSSMDNAQRIHCAPPVSPLATTRTLHPVSVAGAAGFFTGSRSTLTTALEESRKQLKAYMAQLNQTNL